MPSTLEVLALRLIGAKGALFLSARQQLKWYIETTDRKRLLDEIKRIQDVRVCGYLFSVGLDAELQAAVLQRWKELSAKSIPR